MKLNQSYDFYKLTNKQAAPFVGKIIKTEDKREYLVIHWDYHSKNCNYGKEYGLIYLMEPLVVEGYEPYFNFSVSSTDDWDYQVTFYGNKNDLHKQRKKVIKWAQEYIKRGRVSHKEMFKELIVKFNVPMEWAYFG